MDTFKKILDDVDEVDLTPMIDVTFLLLIYFMVTTMIKQPEAELSIQLPGKASSSDVTPMEMLKVRIGDDGEVYMNGSLIEDGIDLEMPDLVGNLKTQKSMRDQLISSGARSKEEAELKASLNKATFDLKDLKKFKYFSIYYYPKLNEALTRSLNLF